MKRQRLSLRPAFRAGSVLAALAIVLLALAGIPALATASVPARGQPDTFGGGTLQVGKDVAPGTYQTQVPKTSVGCYWARLGDLSGNLDAILANANYEPGDLATVTIEPEDVGFQSQGCGTWMPSQRVGPATPAATIGGGTWIVGEDIKPGTYQTTVPEQSTGCYWARLSNLSGDLDSILANDNVARADRVTVTIASGDKGFTSTDCGIWRLI